MTNPQVQKKECLLKSLLHFINKSLLQLDYTNAYLFIKIYNYSMDRSKIISELGSDQDDFESQPTQSYLISSLLPKKKSKIQQLMLSLTKTHSELRAIMRKSNLKEEDILVAFNRGLKILHSVDGKELLQKGKEFFEISQIIAFQLEDYEDIQPQFQQLKKQQFREISEAKQKQEQKLKNAERQKGEERVQQEEKPQDTQKTVKKVAEKQKEEKKQVKENKPLESGKKVQQKPPVVGINGISPSQEKDYLNNKYAFENSTDAFEQKVKSTERKVQQKAADKDAEKEEPEFFLPILWEIKADCGLKITDREIKKISPSSKYENICANKPFQNAQTYRIKFKVIQYGTLAIGLLPSPYKYKSQKCVNVEKQQALKYIAFQNGGGLIQCGSQTLLDSPRVGLQNNMDLEMIYNSKDQKVTFKSERLGSKQVKLPEMFKHYNMYLYFQMKQQHTCVRFY